MRAAELVNPVVDNLKTYGIQATSDVRYGHAADLICEIAKQKPDAQIVIGRAGGFALARRMLGGMALALMQASPVPVTVVRALDFLVGPKRPSGRPRGNEPCQSGHMAP